MNILDLQDKIGFSIIGTANGMFIVDQLVGVNTILTTISLLIAIATGLFLLVKHARECWRKW